MTNKQQEPVKPELAEEYAYSIVRDPEDQKFVLYELKFNPKTKVVESIKELNRDIFFRDIEDQFKVNVSMNVFEKVRNS